MTRALKLRPDSYLVTVPDGVEVVTGRGKTLLRGKSTHLWIDRMKPLLDGTRTFDEICLGLPPKQRESVQTLVSALLRVGAVEVLSGDEDLPDIPLPERERHAGEMDFLRQYSSTPLAAFGKYRQLSVLVHGPHEFAEEFRASFAHTGVTDVRTTSGNRDEGPRAAVRAADIVMHVVNASSSAAIAAAERECHDTPLVQLVLDGTEAWWSPADGPRWTDIRARRLGLEPDRVTAASGGRWFARTPRRILVNMVVQDVFRASTGIGEGQGQAVAFDQHSTARQAHAVRPHPFTRSAPEIDDSAFLAQWTELSRRPPTDQEEFSRTAATLMNSRVGFFTEITQDPMPQMPLKAVTTTVADPVGLLRYRGSLPAIVESDLDFPDARRLVAMRAIGTYASLMVDPRRLVGTSEWFAASAIADPWRAVRELRHSTTTAAVQAIDLLGWHVVHLDVHHAFPDLAPTREPYAASPGVGVGLSWSAALEDAVVQHCGRIAIERARKEGQLFDRVGLPAAPSERSARAMKLLAALGHEVALFDIGGTIDVPTLVCTLDGVAIAYGCGLSYAEALEMCLLATLRIEQGSGAAAPPDLSGEVWGTRECRLPAPARLSLGEAAQRLATHAGRPLVVPLNHDPELAGILPNIVRVVLSDS